ncbi:MAG TPA: hypothetical protein VLD37_05110 [Candidatus Bilamarchaeum sp.]|nr:hypothetical protein [Candidatus Bilamarchaeum sp.]
MAQELLHNPRETTAKGKANGAPLVEEPVSGREMLLRSLSEMSVARFKGRAFSAGFQGGRCSDELALHHAHERDPEAEAKAVSLELMPLKFDISREAYGTGDSYAILRSSGALSFLAFHGIMRDGDETCGLATLALRLPQEMLADALAELKADPRFMNDVLHRIVPESLGLEFSIKTRIDVVYDRSYFVFHLQEDSPPKG